MKEKILNALKTKFKHLGLSDKAFDGVAEFYYKTITEESQIEGVVEGAEAILKVAQGEADRVRNDSQSKKTELEKENKELKEKLEAKPTDPPKPNGGDGSDNSELTELKATVKGLQERLDQKDKTSQKQAKLNKAKEIMLAKGVDKKLCDKMLTLATIDSSDDDAVEAIAERGVNEYNDFVSTVTPSGGTPRHSEHNVSDDVRNDFFAKKKAENEAKVKEIENLKQ